MTDMCESEATEQRLISLESRFSYHERMVEEMSDVMAQQARAIDNLTAQCSRLRERLHEIEAGWSVSPQDDKPPPHY